MSLGQTLNDTIKGVVVKGREGKQHTGEARSPHDYMGGVSQSLVGGLEFQSLRRSLAKWRVAAC